MRARERGNGAPAVWVPPPARREPTRRELPESPPEEARELGAQPKRPPATWVAIHVELRHASEPYAQVADEDEVYVDASPEPADLGLARALPAPAPPAPAEGLMAKAALASDNVPPHHHARVPELLRYLARRAMQAYLAHTSFGSNRAAEPRVLDVRA